MARRTAPLVEVLEEYLHTRQHNARNTQINDWSVLRSFVREVGPIQVGHLTAKHVERYFLGPQGVIHRMNPQSYNKVRQRVGAFITFCEQRGYVKPLRMSNVRARRVHHRERLRLSPSQLLALLDAASDARDRAMLATAMNTALRAGELVALRVGDVNLAAGLLHVIISKSGVEDPMPITRELDTELRRWLTAYGAAVRRPLRPDDRLFPARHAPRVFRLVMADEPRPLLLPPVPPLN